MAHQEQIDFCNLIKQLYPVHFINRGALIDIFLNRDAWDKKCYGQIIEL